MSSHGQEPRVSAPGPAAPSDDGAAGPGARRATWFLLAAIVLFLVVLTWLAPFTSFDETYDLRVYRAGGVDVVHGADPYAQPPHGIRAPFTYPPFAAVAFAPLAGAGLGSERVAVTAMSLLCVVLLSLLAVRAERPLRLDDQRLRAVVIAAAAVGLLLEPVRSTLGFGQVDLLLALFVVADLVPRRRLLPRGVLIGIAAGVKIVPGVFILYLLVTRQLRAAAWAGGAFAVTVAVGFAVMPGAAWRYWTHLAFDSRRVGPVDYVGNQSWRALAVRLFDDPATARAVWLVLAIVTLALGLLIAARLHHRRRELAAICAVALTGLLASPISWNHHWVWALPVAVLLLVGVETAGRRGWTTLGVCWCLIFSLAPIWWVPDRYDYAARYGGWRLLATNSYTLAGVVMLGALAVLARRPGAEIEREGGGGGGLAEPAAPAARP